MTCRITSLLLIMLLSLAAARAEPVSRREVLAAIAVLEGDVTSAAAPQAAVTVTRFGKESDAVLIILGPETLPWMQEETAGAGATVRAMLMAVYFAGDIKSQLERNRAEDDPYRGWLAVIKAYRQMRRQQPKLVIPEVEELIEKEETGRLRQEAENLRRQQDPEEPRPTNMA
ncbi:MAG: hypothetical protein PHE83_03290 [Opitutaceae bacterium]|nr:hypothetical protein [Opitutaceae bacterium]